MSTKPTQLNPKDAVGVSKWRQYATVPRTVIAEIGVAMLEGARKYGRHNYRVAGVSASIYYDAAVGHLDQWWEGEDTDPDSGLSHVVKAIASLVVLRDAMIQDMLTDDRPPRANLDRVRDDLQQKVEAIIARHPEPVEPWTQERVVRAPVEDVVRLKERHELYRTEDDDAPEGIRDRNGDVVLGLCRRCGAGEVQLEQPCRGRRLYEALGALVGARAGCDCETPNECAEAGRCIEAMIAGR